MYRILSNISFQTTMSQTGNNCTEPQGKMYDISNEYNFTTIPFGFSLSPRSYLQQQEQKKQSVPKEMISRGVTTPTLRSVPKRGKRAEKQGTPFGTTNPRGDTPCPSLESNTNSDDHPETHQEGKIQLKIFFPHRISGNETEGTLPYLSKVLTTVTNLQVKNETVSQLLKYRIRKDTALRNMVLTSIDKREAWQTLFTHLHNTFPNKSYVKGKIAYSTALQAYNAYTGSTNSTGEKTKTTFELLSQIQQLSQNVTLGALDQHHNITYVRFRDKLLTIIPFLENDVFSHEKRSDSLGRDRLEELFKDILNRHSPKITRFMRF